MKLGDGIMKQMVSKKAAIFAALVVMLTVSILGTTVCTVAEEPLDYTNYEHYLAPYFESDPEAYAQILSYLHEFGYDHASESEPSEETAAESPLVQDGDAAFAEEFTDVLPVDLGTGLLARSNIVLYRDLQQGVNGDDVKSVQERLAAFGYDVGPVDGVFGPRTEAAVLKFQTDHGLYVDGIIGNYSIRMINSIDDGTDSVSHAETGDSSEAVPAASEEDFVFSRDLSVGSQGNDVIQIQEILKSLGYYSGSNDGVFGNYTKAAVLKFQEDHGLYMDGVIGPITAGRLSALVPRSTRASRPQAAAAAPAEEQPQPQLQWQEGSVMEGALNIDRTLSQGMTGNDVSTLQQRLFDLGYLTFSPDGTYDGRTMEAVEKFQKDHNLIVDGWVGNQTLQALNWRHFLEEPVVSSLADSASISEKCYSREGKNIRFIIPHHMAGRMSGETCAQYFTYNDAGTSANYCIGYAGDIAQNVPEQYGAWTSGDTNFDRQAITIEVSDTSASNYRIPEAAQESLVNLCADIVKRYPSLGGRLVYDPSDEARVIAAKNGTGSWDAIKGNVLLHRWTTTVGTDCPGWHMTSIMPELVERVNQKLAQ